jgi:hypothetical protein
MTVRLSKQDARRILEEAKANVERLRDSERQFAAEREALSTVPNGTVESQSHMRVETVNERHRREIEEQDKQFELNRIARKYEASRSKQADWTQWEHWADARIANAIANERQVVCDALSEEVAKAIIEIYDDVGEEVKALRVEIVALKSSLDESIKELRSLIHSDTAKVIDLPNQRRAN